MWPSEEWASRLFDWANIGLIFSLAVGIVSTMLLVWMGNVKEAYGKITQQNVELKLSKQQERAAEAERVLLAERQHTANRDITPEDQRAISEELKVFAGQYAEIDLFPVNFEGRWVADQISGILLNAKWDIPPKAIKMLPRPPDLMVQGVLVRSTGDGKSIAAAKELSRLLGKTVASGVFDPTPLPGLEHPRIWIFVGDKPTPLRSWVK
jgi:hypothetical protein